MNMLFKEKSQSKILCDFLSFPWRDIFFAIPYIPWYATSKPLPGTRLFHMVNIVNLHMFHKMNQSPNYSPGFILVLYTFGRDLKRELEGIYFFYFFCHNNPMSILRNFLLSIMGKLKIPSILMSPKRMT